VGVLMVVASLEVPAAIVIRWKVLVVVPYLMAPMV